MNDHERVRITATRVRALASSAASLENANDRVLAQLDVLLYGRDDEDGAIVESLRAIKVAVLGGRISLAEELAASLGTEYAAFL